MSFRDKPIQERIDYLRQRHGKQLKLDFAHFGAGQGLWALWGDKNCNLTEFPFGTVAVVDEKILEGQA